MVQMDIIASLNVVRDELKINLAEFATQLELFAGGIANESKTEADPAASLNRCCELLKQTASVLALLQMTGATRLLTEMTDLVDQVHKVFIDENSTPKPTYETQINEYLAGLGLAVIQLEHFIDYTLLKERYFPVLLLERINSIRRLLKKPPLAEDNLLLLPRLPAIYLDDLLQVFHQELPEESIPSAPVGGQCRPFRLMFQTALLKIIQTRKVSESSQYMLERALSRLAKACGPTPITQLWLVARAFVIALGEGHVSLNPSRVYLLTQIERHIKQLIYSNAEVIDIVPPEHLLQEACALVGLASTHNLVETNGAETHDIPTQESPSMQLLQRFKTHFQLNDVVTDIRLQAELQLMNGPSGTVIHSVVQLVHDELTQFKDILDFRFRGTQLPDLDQEKTLQQLDAIAHTLTMVGAVESAALIQEQRFTLEKLLEPDSELNESEMQSFADALVYIEHGLERLLGEYSNRSSYKQQSGENEIMPRGQLEQARHMVFVESRACLSLVKRSLASYVDSHCDAHHLEGLNNHLAAATGALHFVFLDRAAHVLSRAEHFIEDELVQSLHKPDQGLLESLADALTSVDYYLESLEDNKPIGDGILEVAELSIASLDKFADAV